MGSSICTKMVYDLIKAPMLNNPIFFTIPLYSNNESLLDPLFYPSTKSIATLTMNLLLIHLFYHNPFINPLILS